MKGIIVQLSSAMILSLPGAIASFGNVWPSYAINILKSDQSPIGYKISDSEANIISSIPMLGSLMTTLFTGYISEALGRKRTQILCALIYLMSWCLIATAHSATQIIVARLIGGAAAGMALVSILVYITETVEICNRGAGTTVSALFYGVGMLASYLNGWFISYEATCYVMITAIAVFVFIMCFFKETPVWLIRAGRENEALKSLKFYRGVSETTDAVLEELSYMKCQTYSINQDVEKPMLEEIKKLHKENMGNENVENTGNKNPWLMLVTEDCNRRALITIVIFMTLTVSMGMVAVQTYANQFFSKAAPTISPDLCSVLLATVLIGSSFITIIVTDLVTRRTLMISTCFTATVCLAMLGGVLRWRWAPDWVAPMIIIVYCIIFNLGCINIVFIQMSESFGPQVNSTATSVVLCFMFLSNFLVIFAFRPAVKYCGIDGTFFIFAAIGLTTTVLAILFLKETRRVPIEDVQKMYADGFLYRKL